MSLEKAISGCLFRGEICLLSRLLCLLCLNGNTPTQAQVLHQAQVQALSVVLSLDFDQGPVPLDVVRKVQMVKMMRIMNLMTGKSCFFRPWFNYMYYG